MKANRIFWDQDEYQKVLGRAREIKKSEPMIHIDDLFRRSQMCLESSRRRPVSGGGTVMFQKKLGMPVNLGRKVWTREEWVAVAMKTRDILESSPRLTVHSAMTEAIKLVLPPERHSKFTQNRVPQIKRLLSKLPPKVAAPEPAPEPAPAAPERPTAANPFPSVPLPPTAPLSAQNEMAGALLASFANIFGAAFERLGKQIGDAVGEKIGEKIGEAMYQMRMGILSGQQQPVQQAPQEVPVPSSLLRKEEFGDLPPKFHKPKLIVIGLLDSQQSIIKSRFPRIDFRFFDGFRYRDGDITELSKSCNAIYQMTKFSSHQHYTPWCPRHLIPDGMSTLARLIEAHFPPNWGEIEAAKQATKRGNGDAERHH